MAIMMALYHRAMTGEGQRLDTSQLGATVAFQHVNLFPALFDPLHRQRDDGEPAMSHQNEALRRSVWKDHSQFISHDF